MLVVQPRHSLPQRLDPRRGTVLSRRRLDRDGRGPWETARDVIVDLRRALPEVCPFVRVVLVAVLDGALGAPDHTRRGTRGVEAGVGTVTLVGVAECAVGVGAEFYFQAVR